ncbi:TPA: glycine--tRNA ligase [Candidatus Peribacteria bacterium]|nr:MAG: glycine--tRNA ligase [Candidatus Peribacteria bacterium RIFOXYC2_FULL_58_10]HAI98680.1 glycine--tRNA ligase [Candidatus Peribacteria bacterium]HAS34393.1 glycine--tRNA ligase [Candidatus Peribacteria bacterium]
MPASTLDQLTSLCKRRGFIFPGSEIYGGLANTWDYGPLGVEVKNRLKQLWWKSFVTKRADMVGMDSSILMNPKVWQASGHVQSFTDPLVDCRKCKERFRGDKLLEEKLGIEAAAVLKVSQIGPMLKAEKIACPACDAHDWTEAKQFNMMFKTHQGVVEDDATLVYLRPETAQGIFVNFRNVLNTMRPRLPFGIAQIGKAFRNEITPGNFTFRTREFEQMEIEYFVEPGKDADAFEEWKELVWEWFSSLGIPEKSLRFREHERDELAFYSKRTIDIEYRFPWGWGELFGLASRTDHDLSCHQKLSGEDLTFTDPDTPEKKFLPYTIEPSFGCDRTILTLLLEAYTDEELPNGEVRTVMKLDPRIAPIDVAILPLSKKEHLVEKARDLHRTLVKETSLSIDFDITGSIGKRYRRQDEIGTPKCITVDFGTLGEDDKQGSKDTVTIRDRDSLKQERVTIAELVRALTVV